MPSRSPTLLPPLSDTNRNSSTTSPKSNNNEAITTTKKTVESSDDLSSSSSSNPLGLLAPKTSNISDIQWFMLEKSRYYPLTVVNMFAVRSLLYPLTLIRTRLQVQARNSLYTGTFNAINTIIKYEGFFSLYKGFWVNSFQLFPHVLYITSYEVYIYI